MSNIKCVLKLEKNGTEEGHSKLELKSQNQWGPKLQDFCKL